MPVRGALRLVQRAMAAEAINALLERSTVMRLGTVDRDGWPYVVPLSFVYQKDSFYFHHTREQSHLTSCLQADPRVCVEVDEAGPAFLAGDTACQASRAYQSVVAFGRASLVTQQEAKEQAFRQIMVKYAGPDWLFSMAFPRLDDTLVFRVSVEVMTGKKREAPNPSQ